METVFKVKGMKKEDLKAVAEVLGEKVSQDLNVGDIKKKISENVTTKEDPEFVRELLTTEVTERRERQEKEAAWAREKEEAAVAREFELQRNKQENELKIELARIQANQTANQVTEQNQNNTPSQPAEAMSHLKLPALQIPKFNGNTTAWLDFWNQFEHSIQQNESINKIEKFVYLKSLLEYKALDAVSGFTLSEANYDNAIEILKQRFGRTDLVISAHVQKLLSIETVRNITNIKALRKLFDDCEIQIRSLESLNVTSGSYGSLLTPIILQKIPEELNLEFNRSRKADSEYDINELINFLRREINCREAAGLMNNAANKNYTKPEYQRNDRYKNQNSYRIPTASALLNTFEKGPICVFCEKSHKSHECKATSDMSFDEKKALLLKNNACFKCLRLNHHSRACTMNIKCTKCGGKGHNTVMCYGRKNRQNGSEDVSNELINNKQSENSVFSNQTDEVDVLLQTLTLKVRNGNKEAFIRAMIDTGSQRSYATKEIIEVMGFEPIKEVKIVHTLFGGKQTEEVPHKEYILNLSDLENSYNCRIQVLDQKKICNEVARVPHGEWIKEMERMNITISDREEKFRKIDSTIHLLIGADVTGKLLTGKLHTCVAGPVAVQTKLGWTLMGKIPRAKSREASDVLTYTALLCNNLDNLWKLDLIGISESIIDKSEELIREETLAHFQQTVRRDHEGRYEIALPWIHEKTNLESNREVAEKRLVSTKRKLENSGHVEEYGAVFQDWLSKGIIEIAPEVPRNGVHYLPHRAVIKESSASTKIRPVYDASAKKKGMLSLNDCLEKGPNLVAEIPSLLNKFRLKAVAVTSDIEKAFLQIGIRESDRDFLRFFWYDEEQKIVEYRHKRVVFGVTSSPFLLSATLNHHLDTSPNELESTAQCLKKSFYVDNCIASFDSVEEMEKFVLEARVLLSSAQFNLRDWISNVDSRVLDHPIVEKTNLLGMDWNISDDTLSCVVKDFDCEETLTKRKILSIANGIFDPIGFTSPVMLIPKMILQKSWTLKLSWDEPLPEDISKEFRKWCKTLKMLQDIRIPRWVLQTDKKGVVQLHVFCDASQNAYATCIILRYETANQIECSLVQARSRVAPLKKATISRLELIACLIGARLAKNIIIDLGYEDMPVIYWSDSTNALYWIKRNENWGVFVMNRVNEIRKLTEPDCWKHIPGVENPADLPSRGCSAEKLLQTKWWEGPRWLRMPEEEWPTSQALPNMDIVQAEKKKTIIAATNVNDMKFEFFTRISSFRKITRVMGWIKRFVNNCRKPKEKNFGELSVNEIEDAEKVIWKHVQKENLEKQSFNFQTYLDEDGLLKVKSKICMRADLKAFKYPIILPSGNQLVEKLIFQEHINNCHAGIQVIMTKLREQYWIVKSRKTIKRVLKKCKKCLRFTTSPIAVPEAPLPEDRVREARIFEVTGVDLCGPMYLKDESKCWAVLFTCAVYRAVHIEVVTFLTTDSFTLALRRFISRRGRPSTIYSDNGTNLVGTSNAFRLVNWEKVQEISTIKKIQWKFNPPSAPWWGGFWERLIGSLKRILRRVIGNACLKLEEISTVLCEAESLINSRPLTYVSEDPSDLKVLSPSMFLNEIEEFGTADFDEIDAKKMKNRFAYRLRLREDLRKRFRNEYLGQLREYYKVKKSQPLKEGDVVLVGDSNSKRQSWPLARILKLYPGKDGTVRLAQVQTTSGTFLRPLQRLYPLEIQEAENLQSSDLPPEKEDFELNAKCVRTRYGRIIRAPNRLNF